MTGKPPREPKKGMAEPEAAYRHEADDENFVPEGGWDAYLYRNRHAINESCDRADEEYARGNYYTIEEVMAHIRATIKARAKKP
ncbi:MAG: hypothetical protein JOZ72_11130 [Alphaproteobacteria bacterium]|nr:hypothetical protein [Alphaproteobacteria bacterium]